MKIRNFAFLPLVCAAACSSATGDSVEANSSNLVAEAAPSAAITPERIAELKAAIRGISLENIRRTDNLAEVRAQLDPLVKELADGAGNKTPEENLPKVAGAWRQLWTDFPYPMRGPVTMDPEQVYQIVSADGYYYNVGDSKLFGFIPTTGVLRGAYEVKENTLAVKFTKVGYRFGGVAKGRDLVDLAGDLEAGRTKFLTLPGGGEAPNGPVGIGGTLRSAYVDDDIRIDIGTQDPFVDASGAVVVPGVGESIFVLDRVSVPVK